MAHIGYYLSSEEHDPRNLVACAASAEQAGFDFETISDHYHPWTNSQNHSPFVWSVLGGIASATSKIHVGTSVTCPTMRIHPAIIAQAAATTAAMMPGRFFLGVGTGEYLNEHIAGERWPAPKTRLEMLEEAIGILRLLWRGGSHSHYGKHYKVEAARVFDLPERPPKIMVAAAKHGAARLAARSGDGLVSFEPDPAVARTFKQNGGADRPCYGEITVCWAKDQAAARETVVRRWPNAAVTAPLLTDMPTPRHFERAAALASADDIVEGMPLGPDPSVHIAGIQKYLDAGYDHVSVHQIGPDQSGFIRFYAEHVLPHFRDQRSS